MARTGLDKPDRDANKWLNMTRQHSSFNSPEWICSECGAERTRDGNAAINLRKLGGSCRIKAPGHDASTGSLYGCRQVSRMNREPKLSAHVRTFRKVGMTSRSLLPRRCRNRDACQHKPLA